MNRLNNDQGSVIVFVTLIITLLLAMVGIGLDTGMLTYVRSQAQPAVDAAALAAASGLLGGQSEVEARVAAYNSTNDYVGQSGSALGASNITPIFYDGSTIQVATYGTANGVRVGLEKAGTNPYTANSESSVASPLFLTPILNLMGFTAPAQANLNITATAVLKGKPDLPVALKACSVGPMSIYFEPEGQSNGKENACWTTYTISPSSTPNLLDLVNASCEEIPPVDKGTLIDLDNGEKTPVLKAIKNGCYIIPVVGPVTCAEPGQSAPVQSFAKVCVTNVVATPASDARIDVNVVDCDATLLGLASTCAIPVLVRDQPSGM